MWRNDHQQQHNVSAFWFCFCLHLVDHLFVRGGAPADERQGRRLKGGGGGWECCQWCLWEVLRIGHVIEDLGHSSGGLHVGEGHRGQVRLVGSQPSEKQK